MKPPTRYLPKPFSPCEEGLRLAAGAGPLRSRQRDGGPAPETRRAWAGPCAARGQPTTVGRSRGQVAAGLPRTPDREIEVEWRDDLPANGMGQARGPQRIALNRKYLADLTDGSAASRQTGRVHGTERRELLATLLHELTHVYDRARLWSAEEKREIRRCTPGRNPRPDRPAHRLPRAERSPLHALRRPAPARSRRLAAARRPARAARGAQWLRTAQPGRLRAEQSARVRRGEHGVLPPRSQLRLPPPGALPLLPATLRLGAGTQCLCAELRLPQRRPRLRPAAAGPARPRAGLRGRLPAGPRPTTTWSAAGATPCSAW